MDLTQVTQHVRNLYLAARLAPLKADEHEQVQRSALELEKWFKELEATKEPDPLRTPQKKSQP